MQLPRPERHFAARLMAPQDRSMYMNTTTTTARLHADRLQAACTALHTTVRLALEHAPATQQPHVNLLNARATLQYELGKLLVKANAVVRNELPDTAPIPQHLAPHACSACGEWMQGQVHALDDGQRACSDKCRDALAPKAKQAAETVIPQTVAVPVPALVTTLDELLTLTKADLLSVYADQGIELPVGSSSPKSLARFLLMRLAQRPVAVVAKPAPTPVAVPAPVVTPAVVAVPETYGDPDAESTVPADCVDLLKQRLKATAALKTARSVMPLHAAPVPVANPVPTPVDVPISSSGIPKHLLPTTAPVATLAPAKATSLDALLKLWTDRKEALPLGCRVTAQALLPHAKRLFGDAVVDAAIAAPPMSATAQHGRYDGKGGMARLRADLVKAWDDAGVPRERRSTLNRTRAVMEGELTSLRDTAAAAAAHTANAPAPLPVGHEDLGNVAKQAAEMVVKQTAKQGNVDEDAMLVRLTASVGRMTPTQLAAVVVIAESMVAG